jgi:PleD family two-component response regulator
MKDAERRRGKRIYFSGTILINSNIVCKTIDVSEGGVYVYACSALKENSIIDVTFPLKNKPACTVKARVKHSHPDLGMGIQFIDLNAEQKAIIKKIVKSIEKKTAAPQITRRKILLIDDNDFNRQMHKNKLFMEGFSVIEASDGLDAIQLMKTQTPDLIILDVYMEKMDGFKVLMILKSSSKWKNIPIIVFSSRGTQDVIDKVITAGADEFLFKMITSPAKLAQKAKAILARRKG